MPNREIFEWIEIDVPRCGLTYGSSPCAAVLGDTGPRKCFNTRGTCQDFANINENTVTTLRFSRAGLPLPRGFRAYPVLRALSQSSTVVNIAGSDPKLKGIGERGKITFTLEDFTDHDRRFDNYWAERVSGAAQADAVGYIPQSRGTFLARLKARWPNYQGAAVRLCRAYIDGGVISGQTSYHHVMKSLDGPTRGEVRGEAIDILDLATPLCPKPSRGVLSADLTNIANSFTITPVEVADEYAASGRLTIGSEIMSFTRSGATFTVERGQRGTSAAAHGQGDTVQQNYICEKARPDDVVKDIIDNFTDIPSSWINFSDWQAEITRWAAALRLTTDITTPTAVETLLAEIGELGVNVIPDEIGAKLRMRANRPLDGETPVSITDDNARDFTAEDIPDQRLTQVLFCQKRADPTKGVGTGDDTSNYRSRVLTINTDALDRYGNEARTRVIRTRWLDQGDEATAAVISWRLLKRFEAAPLRVTATLDADQKDIRLADVANVLTVDVADETGEAKPTLMQVIKRSEPRPYHDVSVTLQRYEFGGRYGFVAANGTANYSSATDEEKSQYAFAVGSSLSFPDGTEPYRII